MAEDCMKGVYSLPHTHKAML